MACRYLLVPLFGKQPENSPALGFVGRRLKKMAVTLDILAPNEPVHACLPIGDSMGI
jgi:hypothetical protein